MKYFMFNEADIKEIRYANYNMYVQLCDIKKQRYILTESDLLVGETENNMISILKNDNEFLNRDLRLIDMIVFSINKNTLNRTFSVNTVIEIKKDDKLDKVFLKRHKIIDNEHALDAFINFIEHKDTYLVYVFSKMLNIFKDVIVYEPFCYLIDINNIWKKYSFIEYNTLILTPICLFISFYF